MKVKKAAYFEFTNGTIGGFHITLDDGTVIVLDPYSGALSVKESDDKPEVVYAAEKFKIDMMKWISNITWRFKAKSKKTDESGPVVGKKEK